MVDFRIEDKTAERIIVQTLCEQFKMTVVDANLAAAQIATQFHSAPRLGRDSLRDYRLIEFTPSKEKLLDLAAEMGRLVDIDHKLALQVWRMVHELGTDLPAGTVI
jgi:hypothetical protein